MLLQLSLTSLTNHSGQVVFILSKKLIEFAHGASADPGVLDAWFWLTCWHFHGASVEDLLEKVNYGLHLLLLGRLLLTSIIIVIHL